MKLLNRLKHTAEKNRHNTELDILIYENKIIWYWSEQTKYDDGDEITEDQSIDDYIKNGPPSFARDIPAEMLNEIKRTLHIK